MTGQANNLSEEAAAQLLTLLTAAKEAVSKPLKSTEKLIADIYTGRDPTGGGNGVVIGEQGVPLQELREALTTAEWQPPQTTANLFLSRVRQIVSNLTPGVPSFRSKARVPGAARLSDDQNRIRIRNRNFGRISAASSRNAESELTS